MSSKMRKILIVDDEPELSKLLGMRFSSGGWQVFHANNGLEALKVLDEVGSLHCVLSDVKMPKMSGVELLTKIKDIDPVSPEVFLFTGSVNLDVCELMDRGAEMVFRKPFSPKAILQTMEAHLDLKDQAGFDKNRFRDVRSPLQAEVLIESELIGGLKTQSANIARGGMFLQIDDLSAVRLGEEVTFSILLGEEYNNRPVGGTGQVVWIRKEEDLTNNLPKGFGIRFVDIKPHGLLAELVNGIRTKQCIPKA